jgi:molybdate transport system regulatory protein
MELSARNQIEGTATAVKLGGVMAQVTIEIGGCNELVAAITRDSAEGLGLVEGSRVVALIKATEVMVATRSGG